MKTTLRGIICSSHFWGYLADTRGRKKIIITGMVMDSLITIMSSFSHVYWIFVVFKFFNGFAICASHAVNYAYLGEFHSTPTRTKAIMLCGVFSSVATVTMPVRSPSANSKHLTLLHQRSGHYIENIVAETSTFTLMAPRHISQLSTHYTGTHHMNNGHAGPLPAPYTLHRHAPHKHWTRWSTPSNSTHYTGKHHMNTGHAGPLPATYTLHRQAPQKHWARWSNPGLIG
uniref:Major facilitator superfamily (MFS) profile domain-containing protein n=1 Tax=Timema monikensis TaxID=170555 RepID=A0A7R9HTK0_9NEOP|nr:unnamed protein product [Timema monikensis]